MIITLCFSTEALLQSHPATLMNLKRDTFSTSPQEFLKIVFPVFLFKYAHSFLHLSSLNP